MKIKQHSLHQSQNFKFSQPGSTTISHSQSFNGTFHRHFSSSIDYVGQSESIASTHTARRGSDLPQIKEPSRAHQSLGQYKSSCSYGKEPLREPNCQKERFKKKTSLNIIRKAVYSQTPIPPLKKGSQSVLNDYPTASKRKMQFVTQLKSIKYNDRFRAKNLSVMSGSTFSSPGLKQKTIMYKTDRQQNFQRDKMLNKIKDKSGQIDTQADDGIWASLNLSQEEIKQLDDSSHDSDQTEYLRREQIKAEKKQKALTKDWKQIVQSRYTSLDHYYMTSQQFKSWNLRAQTPLETQEQSSKPKQELQTEKNIFERTKTTLFNIDQLKDTNPLKQLRDPLVAELSKRATMKEKLQIRRDQQRQTNLEEFTGLTKAQQKEREFLDIQKKVTHPDQRKESKLSNPTKQQLEYFQVVLPGNRKHEMMYQSQYSDILHERYKETYDKQKKFMINLKQKNGLSPWEKHKYLMSKKTESRPPAEIATTLKQLAASKLKDSLDEELRQERSQMSLTKLYASPDDTIKEYKEISNDDTDFMSPDRLVNISPYGKKFIKDLTGELSMSQQRTVPTNSSSQVFLKNIYSYLATHVEDWRRQNRKEQRGNVDTGFTESKHELYYQQRLQNEYYNSLKLKSQPCRNELMNIEYQNQCFLHSRVNGLPLMTQITQKGVLSLIGYTINKGICSALGEFLCRFDAPHGPFVVLGLVLDDNNLSDEDFSHILRGLAAQARLQQFSYNSNELGEKSVAALKELILCQHEKVKFRQLDPRKALDSVKIANVKVKPEVLVTLLVDVFETIQGLKSLRLTQRRLGNDQKLVDVLFASIQQLDCLSYLNLSGCDLKSSQLAALPENLPPDLSCLILSKNSCPPSSAKANQPTFHEKFVENFKQYLSRNRQNLTLINLADMELGFDAINSFLQVLPSKLISLNISGNSLTPVDIKEIMQIIEVDLPLESVEDTCLKKLDLQKDKNTGLIYMSAAVVKGAESIKSPLLDVSSLNAKEVQDISKTRAVNSYNLKQKQEIARTLRSLNGEGFGHQFDLQSMLSNTVIFNYFSKGWHRVAECFVAQQWRFCVFLIDEAQSLESQTYFTHIASAHQNVFDRLATLEGSFAPDESLILGDSICGGARKLSSAEEQWNDLHSFMPAAFSILYPDSGELQYRQELEQRLTAQGYIDPLIFNAPKISTETNLDLLREKLSNLKVFAAFMPPGLHTIIFKLPALAQKEKQMISPYLYRRFLVEPREYETINLYNGGRPLKHWYSRGLK